MAEGDAAGLRVRVLGPVRAFLGGRELDVGPLQRRAVLAVLALSAGQVVPRAGLIDKVWDAPPDSASGGVDKCISCLRAVLEPGRNRRVGWRVLETRSPGYLLRAAPEAVDAVVFTGQVEAARQAREAEDLAAAGLVAGALRLWQGMALAGIPGRWAEGERARLAEAQLAAVELQAGVLLGLGRPGEVLERLAGGDLTREGLVCLLMQALYQCGRQREALQVFADCRQVLAGELGIEPGPGLRDMQRRILAADPVLTAPGSTAAFAAASPPRVPQEVPADVAGFTGRTGELAAMDALLPTSRAGQVVVCVVSGTAGVGKTALAVRWAHRVQGAFPDGQLHVDLRGYDPDQPLRAREALARFLRALGVADQNLPLEEAERAARYRSIVAGKRLLVVLDNAATAEQVRPLLPGRGTVMVVVTSRDSLAGLVARDGARRLELGLLSSREAVALLTTLIGKRAEANPAATSALAVQCARLPLALRVAAELAASRPEVPLAELAAELVAEENRLQFLDAGDLRSAVATVFSWSYRHLADEAARLFRLLGLHPGPDWDQYAAAALGATTLARTGQLLGILARAHLIQPAGPGRYGMHDLLRAYAVGLAVSHDGEQARQAAVTSLLDYYVAASATAMDSLAPAEHKVRPEPPPTSTPVPKLGDRPTALAWLDAELITFMTLAGYAASNGWPSHTSRLAGMIHRYLVSGHVTEGLTIQAYSLQAAQTTGDRFAEARTLTYMGILHCQKSRYAEAVGYHRQAIALAQDIGDRLTHARALAGLALASHYQGYYQQAADCNQQAIAIFRELGHQTAESRLRNSLCLDYLRQGRYEQAAECGQLALALARGSDDQIGEAETLFVLGQVRYQQGQYRSAADCLQKTLSLAREVGVLTLQAGALTILGQVCNRQGHHDQAARFNHRALALFQETGERDGEAEALIGAGETLLATGELDQARACQANALTITQATGNRFLQARALTGLGEASDRKGHHDRAIGYHQQALTLHQRTGNPGGQAEGLNGMGEALLASGQLDQSGPCHSSALSLARQTGDRYQQARAHHGLAEVCHATGQMDQARQHWQHALDLYTNLGVPEAAHTRTPLPS